MTQLPISFGPIMYIPKLLYFSLSLFSREQLIQALIHLCLSYFYEIPTCENMKFIAITAHCSHPDTVLSPCS